LLAAVRDSQPGEPGLDRLAHQVLRSALEQRQARQANERAGFLADIASHRAQHIIDRTFDLMGAEEGCSRCLPPPREPTRRGPGSRATPGGVLMAASPTDLRGPRQRHSQSAAVAVLELSRSQVRPRRPTHATVAYQTVLLSGPSPFH